MTGGVRRAAIALALGLGMAGAGAKAETFTSAEFLTQNEAAQTSFIEISITMAATVATQANPAIARCIDEWYFEDKPRQEQRNRHIVSVMRQYPDYHPSGVILAVIQKACGSFKK